MFVESVFVLKDILSAAQLDEVLTLVNGACFEDGKSTASGMARDVKSNEQLLAESIPGLIPKLSNYVIQNPAFRRFAMPKAVSNIMVSRYQVGMEYGTHTDSAIMPSGNRSDISFTLFLSDPNAYDGGELAMETSFGEKRIRLEAGSLVLYPTGGLHRVTPVTRGERIAVVGWVESRIRDSRRRQIILDLDQARREYLEKVGHDRTADLLVKSTANLRRMWDE